jgi:hypothetical protein
MLLYDTVAIIGGHWLILSAAAFFLLAMLAVPSRVNLADDAAGAQPTDGQIDSLADALAQMKGPGQEQREKRAA